MSAAFQRPGEQLREGASFRFVQRVEQRALGGIDEVLPALLGVPPGVGQGEQVGTSVCGAAAPFDETLLVEAIDDGDDGRAVDAEPLAQFLLRHGPFVDEQGQHGVLLDVDAQRLELADLEPVFLALASWGARSPVVPLDGDASEDAVMLGLQTFFGTGPADWNASYEVRLDRETYSLTVVEGQLTELSRTPRTEPANATVTTNRHVVAALLTTAPRSRQRSNRDR